MAGGDLAWIEQFGVLVRIASISGTPGGQAPRGRGEQMEAPQELGTGAIEAVEGADLDQGLGLVLVRGRALEEIGQRDERAALRARSQDRCERALRETLHLGQPDAQGRGRKPFDRERRPAPVDVRRQDRHREPPRLLDVHARVVVAGLAREERREVDGGMVRLEPHRAVGDAPVGHRVRLAEGEGGEVGDEVPHAHRVGARDPLLGAAGEKTPGEVLEVALAALLQRAPQEVRLGEVHARHARGDLHDVLLVQHHAVRVPQEIGEARVRCARLLELAEAAHVGVLHPGTGGTGTDERDRLDHVVHRVRAGLLQEIAHPRRLDLEAAQGAALDERLRRGRIVLGDLLEVDFDPARAQTRQAVVDRRQRAIPEQIHLHEPDRLDRVLVELRDDHALRRAAAGDEIRDRSGSDDDASGMEAVVARGAEQARGGGEDARPARIVEGEAGSLRSLPQRVLDRVRAGVCGGMGRPRQPPRPAVRLRGRDSEDERRLAEGRAHAAAVDRRDHRRALGAEESVHVLEHFVAAPPAEVEIDVGPVGSCGGQEALEGQAVAQRIGVGEAQAVGDQAVGGRAAVDAGDALLAREVGDPLHEQEVGREAEALDRRELVVEAVQDLGLQRPEALARARERQRAQVRGRRLAACDFDRREQSPAERGFEGAALADRERAREGAAGPGARNTRERS